MDNAQSQFDKFTNRARRALVLAREEARRRGQTLIEPEHLLLGLLFDAEDTASEVLRAGGVTLKTAQTDVETLLPPVLSPEQIAPVEKMALAPRTKQVIKDAVEEIHLLKDPYFATGHFLLGMLHEGRIGELFASWEIDLAAIRASMQRLGQPAIAREQLPDTVPTAESQPVFAPEQQTVPVAGAVELDAIRQEKIVGVTRRAGMARAIFIIAIAALFTGLIIALQQLPDLPLRLFLFFVALLANPVLGWEPVAGWWPLLVLLGSLCVAAVLLLLALPLSWYISQVLLRRSGLAQTSTLRWLRGVGISFLPFLCEFCLLLEVITLLAAVQPATWWAWSALAVTLFFVIMGGLVGSHRFLLLGRKLAPLREAEVVERFQALRARLGLPECAFYQLKVGRGSRTANAFFAGWGKGRRVVLTDSMLVHFSLDEIEVILAHELGHLAYHDIWTRYLINGLICLGSFGLAGLYLNAFASAGYDLAGSDLFSALIQPLAMLLVLILLITFLWVQRRYKRYQEDRADEYALRATNNVQAFKDAMTRLTNLNLVVAAPKKRAGRQATHPTLIKRLQHADEFSARQQTFS